MQCLYILSIRRRLLAKLTYFSLRRIVPSNLYSIDSTCNTDVVLLRTLLSHVNEWICLLWPVEIRFCLIFSSLLISNYPGVAVYSIKAVDAFSESSIATRIL